MSKPTKSHQLNFAEKFDFVLGYVVDLDLASRLSFTHMMELRDESVKAASVMSVANVSAAKVSDKNVVPKDRVKLYPAGRRILLTKKSTHENFQTLIKH